MSARDRLVVAGVDADVGVLARLVRPAPEDQRVRPHGCGHRDPEGNLDGVGQLRGRHESFEHTRAREEDSAAHRHRHGAARGHAHRLVARCRSGDEECPEDPQARCDRDEDGGQFGQAVRQDKTEEVPDSAVAEDDGR